MKSLLFFLGGVIFPLAILAQAGIDSNKNWSSHFQLTGINQNHLAFKANYSGTNSLSDEAEHRNLSLTSTLFLGRKLWKNTFLYFDPEITGGSGISGAKGIAGFTNGETFRIGSTEPVLYIARLYFKHDFPLKNTAFEKVPSDKNQVEENIPTSRINIIAGKISLSDFFDNNTFSHDPRSQFMNWSLMSNGAWDYPADTRGYTEGIITELIKPTWAIRVSSVLVPRKANGLNLDYKVAKAHSETIEAEKSWKGKRTSTIRVLAFHTLSQAPTYRNTINETKNGDSTSVDVYTGQKEWKRYGGIKYGFGVNGEMQFSNSVGIFLKASWNDGKTATWAFTEIDRTISSGINLKGNLWKRPNDNIGVAQVINGLSRNHRDFLRAGLYGFIIGDGHLNYSNEAISEIYYQAKLASYFFVSADYQFVNNPAYNKDRGPVHVFAIRGHIEL